MSVCDKSTDKNKNNDKSTYKEVTNYLNYQNEELTLEDLAPDGGWGWMIAFSMIVVYVTTFAAGNSFAIVFGDFFEESGQSGSAMTILNSVYMISFSLSGAMTNALLKKYSLRFISVAAAVLSVTPTASCAFITHVYQLGIIFLIQGAGAGLMDTILSANLNAYFVKKRAKVTSGVQVIIGIGSIVFPLIIDSLLEIYGFRGMVVLVGALSFHSIPAMMLIQPVEWHLRDPNEVLEEKRQLRISQTHADHSTIDKITIVGPSDRRSSLRDNKDEHGCQEPLLALKSKTIDGISPNLDNEIKPRSKSISIRRKSVISQKENHNTWEQLSELFELSLLKDKKFMIMTLGISFVFVSDATFVSLVPLAMLHDGYTNSETAATISITAAAELGSRIFYLLFTLFVNCRAKFVFFCAMIVMGFARFAYIYFESTLMGIYICTAGMGIVRTFLIVPQPLVVVENHPIEMYAACYGIFALINGVIMVVIGPLVGIIKDATDSFKVGQLVLIALHCVFIVPWALEFLVDYRQKRRSRVINTNNNTNNDNNATA